MEAPCPIAMRLPWRTGSAGGKAGFPGGTGNQILLMKWMEVCQTEQVGNEGHPCPAFPKIAIHGNFTLAYEPFHK